MALSPGDALRLANSWQKGYGRWADFTSPEGCDRPTKLLYDAASLLAHAMETGDAAKIARERAYVVHIAHDYAAKAMQQRNEPKHDGNNGGVLPVRCPLEEAPDSEQPGEGGRNPSYDVGRSQSSGNTLRVSLGAVADIRNKAQG